MPIMNPKPRLDDLPEHVRAAFANTGLLSLPKVAKLIGLHPQTLTALAVAGKVSWRQKGLGASRPRRAFTVDDVARLWHTMRRGPVVGPDNRSPR